MRQIKTIIETAIATIHSYIAPENNIFFDAVHQGKYDEVKKLLKSSRVNSFSKVGQTPLGYACQNLDLEMVNLLLDNGADPNIYETRPPLLYAIESTHNWHNTSGLSKDMLTALQTHENNTYLIVKHLIDAKADISYTDKEGNNLLISAAYGGNDKIVQLLIELGADPQSKNKKGKNVFHYALMGENKDIIKMMCDMATLEKLGEYQKQIPEDYKLGNKTKDLINTLRFKMTIEQDLTVKTETRHKPKKI
jgi:ankyrin repeat protein